MLKAEVGYGKSAPVFRGAFLFAELVLFCLIDVHGFRKTEAFVVFEVAFSKGEEKMGIMAR